MTWRPPCERCRTEWPRERMKRLLGRVLCELCFRGAIYPWRTAVLWRANQ